MEIANIISLSVASRATSRVELHLNAPPFLSRMYIQRFLPTYDGYQANILRVDSVRYFWLYHYAGVYAGASHFKDGVPCACEDTAALFEKGILCCFCVIYKSF